MTPFQRAVERIRADRRRGAAPLARAAVRALAAHAQTLPADPRAFSGALHDAVGRLARVRPTMAPIAHWARAFERRVRNELDAHPGVDPRTLARRAGGALLREQRALAARLVAAARPLLGGCGTLLTLSHASTVERLLREAAPHAAVIVCESRPLFEGRRLAKRLHDAGRAVTLITEAQAALFVPRADAVLVGADAVLADGAVVNKTGTHALCLLARAHGTPVYVAADASKRLEETAAGFEPERGDPAEVWARHPELCANRPFECTPAALVDLILCERGPLTPAAFLAR